MRLHLIALVFWVVMSIPILIWWRDSVVVIVGGMLYAILVSHWSAYQGARAEQAILDSPLTPDKEEL
jgi:hypothetical protein